jgi:hypothetical protein
MWFLPLLTTVSLVNFPIFFSLNFLKRIDQGWIEYFGIQQFFNYFIFFSKFNLLYQNNNFKIYLIIFVFWIFFLVFFIFIL